VRTRKHPLRGEGNPWYPRDSHPVVSRRIDRDDLFRRRAECGLLSTCASKAGLRPGISPHLICLPEVLEVTRLRGHTMKRAMIHCFYYNREKPQPPPHSPVLYLASIGNRTCGKNRFTALLSA